MQMLGLQGFYPSEKGPGQSKIGVALVKSLLGLPQMGV